MKMKKTIAIAIAAAFLLSTCASSLAATTTGSAPLQQAESDYYYEHSSQNPNANLRDTSAYRREDNFSSRYQTAFYEEFTPRTSCNHDHSDNSFCAYDSASSISALRSISMSVKSPNPRKISMEVILVARGTASKIGFRSLRLQRYQRGTWQTVKTWSLNYRSNSRTFTFLASITGLPSDYSYRLVGNFVCKVGRVSTAATRSTWSIVCK